MNRRRYDVWDIHHDAAGDRMLLLSSAGSLPNDQLGVIEIDLETFELTTIQQWFNENPSSEAPALQGLATGDGQTFLFRPLYNDLQVYDGSGPLPADALQVPGGQPSWVLGGLGWVTGLEEPETVMVGDADGDCTVGVDDLVILIRHFGLEGTATWREGDCDGDRDVDVDDLVLLIVHFGDTCTG